MASNRREFLQLAQHFEPEKHDVQGWYVSEKLDGTRCFWDGGISRGLSTDEVPWASVLDPKTGKRKGKIKPISTGLWSRYGNPIMAPDDFLNQLPCCFLDGELWAGRGSFQLSRSICGGDEPDPRFDQISFAVYSSPPPDRVFGDGEIKNTNMLRSIEAATCISWVQRRAEEFDGDFVFMSHGSTFDEELHFLNEMIPNQMSPVFMHKQVRLPADKDEARKFIETYLAGVLDEGGEGVVLRNPDAIWTPTRNRGILKYKPHSDAETVVTGFTSGRETAKGSKLLGKIGALITSYNGKRLELAGLTDEEREFDTPHMVEYATHHPGIDMPDSFQGKHFRVGQKVTFKYRELSDDGIPKEARFFRRRDIE